MKVQYLGATDQQVQWGGCSDPRGVLTDGMLYEVERSEVHSWHTKLFLNGYPGMGFNSVCFSGMEDYDDLS